jgi:hypothetical protein
VKRLDIAPVQLLLAVLIPMLVPAQTRAMGIGGMTPRSSRETLAPSLFTRRLGPNVCRMAFPDFQATDICFTPSHVAVAERQMPVTPIHPGSLVWRLTRLRLRHVMLRADSHPFDINYLYGHRPLSSGSEPVFGDGKGPPYYVFISEITVLPTPPTYAMAHPMAQGGYWSYYVSMPCRHLALTVNSNVSASIAAQVMRGLRAKAPCGK